MRWQQSSMLTKYRSNMDKQVLGGSNPATPDAIHKPSHYTYSTIETIDVIEAWNLDFCLGNVLKYVSRAGHKGCELQDLRKAEWYLLRAIDHARARMRE